MKKRLLALLLALVMTVGLLPAQALAPAEAEALYLQMLELGLVDEYGALIEDNAFTVEDGTKLASLAELEDYLALPPAADVLITVDATGRSATAEQMAYALSIEHDMMDIAAAFNRLARSGPPAANRAAVNNTPQVMHNAAVGARASILSTGGDDLRIVVEVTYPTSLTNDVVVEAGLFADFLQDGDDISMAGYGFDSTGFINAYKRFTLPTDGGSAVMDLDLAKIRALLQTRRPDLLNGSAPMTFQWRVVEGAREMTGTEPLLVQAYPGDMSQFLPVDFAPKMPDGSYHEHEQANGWWTSFLTFFPGETPPFRDPVNWELVDMGPYGYAPGGEKMLKVPLSKISLDSHSDAQYGFLTAGELDKAIDLGMGNPEPSLVFKNVMLALPPDLVSSSATVFLRYDDGTKLGYGGDPDGVKLQRTDQETMEALATKLLYPGNLERARLWIQALDTSSDFPPRIATFKEVDLPLERTGNGTCTFPNTWYFETDEAFAATASYVYSFLMMENIRLKDDVAPHVESVTVPEGADFYPGQQVPVTVTFNEPVRGAFQLALHTAEGVTYLDEAGGQQYGSVTGADDPSQALSSKRTFLYEVGRWDSTYIQVAGVKGLSGAEDFLGNGFAHEPGLDYQEFSAEVAQGQLVSSRPEDSILLLEATPDQASGTARIKVVLDSEEASKTLWGNWNVDPEAAGFDPVLVVNNDTAVTYPLTLGTETVDGNEFIFLSGAVTLPASYDQAQEHLVELYFVRDGRMELHRGAYVMARMEQTIKALPSAFTLAMGDGKPPYTASSWPSGQAYLVRLLDGRMPEFKAKRNDGHTFTYDTPDQFYWKSTDEAVFVMEYDQLRQTWRFVPKGAGKAKLQYWAKNGSEDPANHTCMTDTIDITVEAGGTPGIAIPENGNTFFVREGEALTIPFSSNLAVTSPEGDAITAKLYSGKLDAPTGDPAWSGETARAATSAAIPADVLDNKVPGDGIDYTLFLSVADLPNITAIAYIVVQSQPAVVTLSGLEVPQFVSGGTVNIGWTVEHFDVGSQFEFRVEKDGVTVGDAVTKTGAAEDGGSYSGSYSLTLAGPANGALREYYVVTAKAKNQSDPTWSTASSTVTVYRSGALDILVDGQSVDEVTLKNQVEGTATTAAPTITNLEGTRFDGLTTTLAIAKLRGELGLLQGISINHDQYDWSMLTDMIQWETSSGGSLSPEEAAEVARAVTLNYRRGSIYEPLENFSYLYYLPQTILMLCGLRDGTSTVTASHQSIDALSDSVTVNVERLKDKLYLFQFTPAIKTELSYINGKGEARTVHSNDDGSLVLYEPDGIASDLRTASSRQFNGEHEDYRGTFSAAGLKSGEGNGVRGELYPLNALELRRAAVAEITLRTPEGTPLRGAQVRLRGGVYRNAYQAENRDDAYCAEAMFAKTAGAAANLDGKVTQTFTTDQSGVLCVHMDLTQFTTSDFSGAVGVGDDLQFIFELQFEGDAYYPVLITVDASLTPKDAMRTGQNLLFLEKAEGKTPFVAAQTVDYTGRQMDVRRHTGVVGPSSNYDSAILRSTVMLWGESADIRDTGYRHELRSQQTNVSVPVQTCATALVSSYPFSSIPLVNSEATINSAAFARYVAHKKTPMEIALYRGDGSLRKTIPLPFGLVDMTKVEKVDDSKALTSLMANIAAYGTVGGANTNYDFVNQISDGVINYALQFMTDMGGEVGLVRAILTPTEDPTRFSGYFWTGMNTTKLEDLNYDSNGVSMEMNYVGKDMDSLLGQVNDTFTLSDFKAMANGSYFDDRPALYAAASSAIGIPIMFAMEGWMSTEIRYNFDKGEWEVVMTGGGFTSGGQLEFEKAFNVKPMGIPLTFSIKLRGGLTVDFQAAARYAMQGLPWSDENAKVVNDYLTALRINAYLELFGGLGHDKGFTAKVGTFGSLDINSETRFLTRNYLRDPDHRDWTGQFFQLNGETGLRLAFGVGPVVTEMTIVSFAFESFHPHGKWEQIDKYWRSANSGLGSTGWLQPEGNHLRLMAMEPNTELAVVENVTKLQERDYLADGGGWVGGNLGGAPSLHRRIIAGGAEDILAPLETNAYPYSSPLISDDGELLVYLSDADSTDVTDVQARFSKLGNGKFPDGEAIDGPAGVSFAGYGDSSLTLDGTGSFAGAAWLREAALVEKPAGAALEEGEQALLLNGLEVMASIWDGSGWTTTRITDNGTQDLSPVIALSETDKSAIVAWRSVQSGSEQETLYAVSQERILYRIYNGTAWSDTYTLYNGASGSVKGLAAEMLPDGTAAVAYTLDDGTQDDPATGQITESGSEIYYSVINTKADTGEMENTAKTIRATTNQYLDESPKLTTTKMGGTDVFVLGWHSLQSQSGVEQNDVGLRVFDKDGAPQGGFPESLSDMVSTAAFSGQFAFSKGAASLEQLSVIWNDANAGGENNDVLRAVKFGQYGGGYGASAPIEVAEMPERTSVDHFDAYVSNAEGTQIKAVIQGTTYSDTEFEETSFSYDYVGLDGTIETHTGTASVPKETVGLYTAIENYEDRFEVSDVAVDYSTLAVNAQTPIAFTLTNQGMHVISGFEVQIDGGQPQAFTGLNLLPGQSKTISAVHLTGAVIKNLPYTATATFENVGEKSVQGTVYLDYPDVGISGLRVTSEQDGLRSFQVSLYNQSPASLHQGGNRRVVLGFYSDPDCQTPVNGKYFDGGTTDQVYELALDSQESLKAIDGAGYSQSVIFKIGAYVKEAENAEHTSLGLTEIPEAGVPLYVKARIEQKEENQWITLPEADSVNNQVSHIFDSLISRNQGVPATLTVNLDNSNASSTKAEVTVRNNSLAGRTVGNVVASLLDANGNVLETQQSYKPNAGVGNGLIALDSEQEKSLSFTFQRSGAQVVASYGSVVLDNRNAALSDITLKGTSLTLDSFQGGNAATLSGLAAGSYPLVVLPENPGSTVTVDGAAAENGTASIAFDGSGSKRVSIVVTAPDGQTTETYTLTLKSGDAGGDPDDPDDPGSGGSGGGETTYRITLPERVDGGSVTVRPTYAGAGDTVTITAVPAEGYVLESLTVTDGKGRQVDVKALGGGRYTFIMPASRVKIGAAFVRQGEVCDGGIACPSRKFADVDLRAWYHEALDYVVTNGLMAGTGDTTFSPNTPMTRAMLATVLWRLEGSPAPTGSSAFADVPPDAWYAQAVLWAAEKGIAGGYGNGLFGPGDHITREQAAAILYRYARYKGYDVSAGEDTNILSYKDADQISEWAIPAMQWACGEGIITGKGGGVLDPQGQATRVQVAAMLQRFLLGR